ncbi:MAG TPA: hypothetical protein VN841_21720 [Bryobacteraceae bacterium]|nr:hypothetical protein [Bryobacteraceae bacterium]
MSQVSKAPLLAFTVALLMAADPNWKTKPSPQWSEDDAKEVLTASPWAKMVTAGIARPMSEDELRAGGEMGEHHGVGYDGVEGNKPRNAQLPKSVPDLLFGKGPTNTRFEPGKTGVRVVWESALPVRVAELKSREVEPPTLDGDGYRISVYDVPGAYFKDDPKKLGEPLKNEAFLRREGKKDVKPLRVEVFQRGDTLVVAYLFPLSAELTKKDGVVEFSAHIGRVVVDQHFDLAQMEFLGKLEL